MFIDLERQEGGEREREKEREKHQSVAFRKCPDGRLNLQSRYKGRPPKMELSSGGQTPGSTGFSH